MHPQSKSRRDSAAKSRRLAGSGAKPRATSYDVARLAGVSQSAVSRAFRDGGSLSAEKRARVEEAARELGYSPSNIARSLITQRSRMVGVAITDMTTRNYPDILYHLGQEIQATGNRMLVCTTPHDEDPDSAFADLLAYHVDGLISCVTMPEASFAAYARHHVPIVLYNRVPRGPLASAVGCDHATAMEDLVAHLVKTGMGRSVFLAGPENAPVSNDRLRGAQTAMAARGLELGAIVYCDYSYDGGRSAAQSLLSGANRPDTVICANDAMALGVIDACRHDLGLRVPDDVAVTGFDDIPQASWPSYGLTGLTQPVRTMTRAAVRMLMEHVQGEALGAERRLFAAQLQLRQSTRPIQKESPS